MVSFDGGIYRVVPTTEPENTFDDWPEKLSETGIYTDIKAKELTEEAIRYEVNAPFWSDNADKERFVILPEGSKIGFRQSTSWEVPIGSTLVKNFRHADSRRMLETRLIKRTPSGWESATYVWEPRNREATLHPEGQQFETWGRPKPGNRDWVVNSWHAPSSSECASCHVDAAGYVLGFNTAQLNREVNGVNQIKDWVERGWLELPDGVEPADLPKFCSPSDNQAPLDERARVYLDVNCAMCHRPNGPGNANIDLRFATQLDATRMLNEKPAQGDLGIPAALIVAPGEADRSLLLHRVKTRGPGRMPNIGSNVVDEAGVKLLKQWINGMK